MSSSRAADLVVVGAGTMGAWTAYHAHRAGMRTVLVDAYGAGHPRATSGDETRIIRSSHGDDRFLTRWSREARDEWIRFGNEWGQTLYVETGALWFGRRDGGFETTSMATLEELAIPIERLTVDDLAHRWPQVSGEELAFVLFEPQAGALMARRGVAAVAAAFGSSGGRFELAFVRPGKAKGRRLLDVVAGDGTRIAAGAFVFACGPWLPGLFPEILGDLIKVTKQDVFFVGPPSGDARFAAEWLPCWVDYERSFYGVPALDGRGMKAACDRYGPAFDPSIGERLVDPESARVTRSYVARRFPALAGQPFVETRVCQYESTVDAQFVIDRHPEFDNVWLVGGGSGHGFKHGPVIGRYVLGRMAGAAAGPDDEQFSLSRPRLPRPGLRTSARLS